MTSTCAFAAESLLRELFFLCHRAMGASITSMGTVTPPQHGYTAQAELGAGGLAASVPTSGTGRIIDHKLWTYSGQGEACRKVWAPARTEHVLCPQLLSLWLSLVSCVSFSQLLQLSVLQCPHTQEREKRHLHVT